MKLKESFKLLADLNKVKITIAVTFTTFAGYALARNTVDWSVLGVLLGIFILACGSAALNHYQDSDKDAIMERTKNRPIPSGKISTSMVFIIAIAELVLGTVILYISSNMLATQLGLLAFIWYNGIYTPLKKRTAFAVFPGSIIGALPPMVGWVAGGGSLNDPRLILLAFFFFIWQVPHFWLLMLKYGKEYQKAGYPSITDKIGTFQIKMATFVWVFATAVTAIMLTTSGLIYSVYFKILVVMASIWVVIVFFKLLKTGNKKFNPFHYFMKINYFVLVMILTLSIDPIIH